MSLLNTYLAYIIVIMGGGDNSGMYKNISKLQMIGIVIPAACLHLLWFWTA